MIGGADPDEHSTRQASRHPTGALTMITSPWRRRLNDPAFTLGALFSILPAEEAGDIAGEDRKSVV